MLKLIGLVGLMFCAATTVQASCGGAGDACSTENGDYHISLPEQSDGAPMVVFLHGYSSHGMASQNSANIASPILERGYALISPNALMGTRATAWNFHPRFDSGRNEPDFIAEVVHNAAEKFGLDADRVLLAGFSLGGSMTSYIACYTPEGYTAFAPVSGSFWLPEPESCTVPIRLFHTHGWADKTVPIEGREVSPGFIQGNVFPAFETLRLTNKCVQPHAGAMNQDGIFMRRRWDDCAPEAALELALFPGGHTVPAGWADMVLDWFEALP